MGKDIECVVLCSMAALNNNNNGNLKKNRIRLKKSIHYSTSFLAWLFTAFFFFFIAKNDEYLSSLNIIINKSEVLSTFKIKSKGCVYSPHVKIFLVID